MSNEKITHPRTRRPAISTHPRQLPLSHNDVRLTNQTMARMTDLPAVVDEQGRPLRPTPSGV